MRDRQSNFVSSTAVLDTAFQWAPRIILLSLVVIMVSTLYPFKFSLSEPFSLLISRTSKLDILANIVLFVPLGFGLASALAKRKYSFTTNLLAIVFLGGSLSLTIEILQAFLSGRDSSLWDVLTNTTGAGAGYLLFGFGGTLFYQRVPSVFRWLQTFLDGLKLQHLILAVIGYAGLAVILALSWQGLSLHSWAIHQPLSVGSNVTVQIPRFLVPQWGPVQTRGWNGTVSDLVISDRALSDDEITQFVANPDSITSPPASVLAWYPLKGKQALQDRSEQSPNLVWQGARPTASARAGVNLTGEHWLATATPVTLINQRIRNSAQFTLSATLAAADLDTSSFIHPPALAIGPRLTDPIHLKELWENSNFVLSQVGSELVLQMRISRMGWDRQAYAARIPDVFLDTKPHRVCISYSGFVVRVYIDSPERSFIFDATPNRYQIVFYVLMLMPLALLLSLVANRLQHRLVYLVLIAGGAMLPSLGLESLLVSEANRPMRAANVLLGFLIMGGTILACKKTSAHSRSSASDSSVS